MRLRVELNSIDTIPYIIVSDTIHPNWNSLPIIQDDYYPFFAIDSLSNDFLSVSTEDYYEIETYTFYEWRYDWWSFIKDTTVLAAVKNYGRLFPYISSLIIALGLLIHIIMRLTGQIRIKKMDSKK